MTAEQEQLWDRLARQRLYICEVASTHRHRSEVSQGYKLVTAAAEYLKIAAEYELVNQQVRAKPIPK
jgi:hypothetical protein